ncbi:uncharacterized protein [Rutidosis leptorrhynchoides]|uniref:uncharacterized protein n=1 Tax=Rutidosis leptorrhynchoides TaxID=125765 RepID=UPI003A9A2F57
MACMGFGKKWRKWILACLQSATISILINGSPTREFSIGRGVRQGDPLSPFLFILAAEGLNLITKVAVNKGLYKGVEIGQDKIVVSHLQYADDTMFFGDWSIMNARNLFNILKCFELASGLKVNFQKSRIYGVGVDSKEVEDLACRMGCQADKFPFIYIGLPIGAKMRKISNWAPVIDKFNNRLSDWKMRTLSFGGRLVLLKSVLSSLPLYYFTLFRAPPCVLKHLESTRWNFFWGGGGVSSSNKITWVKWDHTCLPYGEGGLNIGSLKGKNLALLGKSWWRFKIETNCLWTNIIRSIYGIDGGLSSRDGSTHLSTSGVWNNIIHAGLQIDELNISFVKSFKKSIGDGRSTLFWEEVWCGSEALKNVFPRIFRLEQDKNASIRDRVSAASISQHVTEVPVDFPQRSTVAAIQAAGIRVAGGAGGCNHASTADSDTGSIIFKWVLSRIPTGRTKTELVELENLIRTLSFDFNVRDSWKWSLSNNGFFTVKRLSTLIDAKVLTAPNQAPNKMLRNNLLPRKIEIFVWRVLKKRLPVRIELDKRGIDLHSVRCPICDNDLESVDHTLFNCSFTSDIWNRIFKWWDFGNFSPSNGPDSLHGKSSHVMSPLGSKIWQAVAWVTLYYLWKNRNLKAFQNKGTVFRGEWIRSPTGRTLSELQDLSSRIASYGFNNSGRDSCSWILSHNGIFTVKSLSHLIDCQLLGEYINNNETMRNKLVPKKLEILCLEGDSKTFAR